MSISFVTGKPGGGKGLYTLQNIVEELRKGRRPIITNLPIKLGPWVNGSGQPQAGLVAYLQRKYGQSFDAEKRVFILTDEQCKEFYRWRVNVKTGELVQCGVTEKGKDGQCVAFDTTPMVENGGVMYAIDEAWKFFGAREWQSTGRAALFYTAQHRHFGDDVLFVTQNSKQIDTALRMVSQDYHQVRNHGKERFGLFRQPGIFSVYVYGEPPSPGATPMSRTTFRLDAPGLGGSYDTSAGVGIVGQAVADLGERKKGLHWAWIAVAAVVVIFLGVRAPFWIGRGLTHSFIKGTETGRSNTVAGAMTATKGVVSSVVSNAAPSSILPMVLKPSGSGSGESKPRRGVIPADRPGHQVEPAPVSAPAGPLQESDEALTGIVKIGGKVWVMTTKRNYAPGDRSLELVTPDFCVIRGAVYRWPENMQVKDLGGASVFAKRTP
jgi:hypothetical protein